MSIYFSFIFLRTSYSNNNFSINSNNSSNSSNSIHSSNSKKYFFICGKQKIVKTISNKLDNSSRTNKNYPIPFLYKGQIWLKNSYNNFLWI